MFDVDLWPYQDDVTVTGFHAEIVESRLHQFNTRSLLGFVINGTMKGPKRWKPRVTKVHVSERALPRKPHEGTPPFSKPGPAPGPAVVEMYLTPVVEVEQDEGYRGTAVPFRVRVEKTVQSVDWDKNLFLVHCGPFQRTIELDQFSK